MSFELKTVNAVTDLGKKPGAAGGHRFLCDDENDYVVKFVDTGNKIAINEIVAGSLALNLELPTPNKILVNIPQEVIDESPELSGRGISSITHIGSKGLPDIYGDFKKIKESQIQDMTLTNTDALYGVTVFDNWVCNKDRNNLGNNMVGLLPRNKIRYAAIDYSHCFLDQNWTAEILNTHVDLRDLMSNFPFIQNKISNTECFEPWIEKIETFEESKINSILGSIPTSWNFVQNEQAAMLNFLKSRRNIIRDIINTLEA